MHAHHPHPSPAEKPPRHKKGADKAPAFDILESALATAIGITRDSLRGIRIKNLTLSEDWHRVGREVCYTASGAEKVRRICSLPADALAALLASAATVPEVVTLRVRRIMVSRHTIEAHWPEENPHDPASEIMRVTVGNSEKFVKGMDLPCRHVEGNLYECTRPAPRWRGKW